MVMMAWLGSDQIRRGGDGSSHDSHRDGEDDDGGESRLVSDNCPHISIIVILMLPNDGCCSTRKKEPDFTHVQFCLLNDLINLFDIYMSTRYSFL